jgi:hypothetical protein
MTTAHTLGQPVSKKVDVIRHEETPEKSRPAQGGRGQTDCIEG